MIEIRIQAKLYMTDFDGTMSHTTQASISWH